MTLWVSLNERCHIIKKLDLARAHTRVLVGLLYLPCAWPMGAGKSIKSAVGGADRCGKHKSNDYGSCGQCRSSPGQDKAVFLPFSIV